MDRQPTRRGPGWETSEPIADERSAHEPDPVEVAQAEEVAAMREAKFLERQASERSEPLPAGVTRQQLRHVRTAAPGRPA